MKSEGGKETAAARAGSPEAGNLGTCGMLRSLCNSDKRDHALTNAAGRALEPFSGHSLLFVVTSAREPSTSLATSSFASLPDITKAGV